MQIPTRETAAPPQTFPRALDVFGQPHGRRRGTSEEHTTHPWYLVLWLTGVDYFSTLGYQPGIALLAAGAVSPIATAILVIVTLACALPIYAQVARRSYAGQGSIALLENLLTGWKGRLFVLVLLGFAGTDFVITMTLSAADAAQHAIENPYLHPLLGESRMEITIGLLVLLALVFLAGFKEAIRLAGAVAIPYLLLNLVVLARSFWEIAQHPELFRNWQNSLAMRGDWTMLVAGARPDLPQTRARTQRFRNRGLRDAPGRWRRRSSPTGLPAGPHTQHPQTAGVRGADHERHAGALQLRHHPADSARKPTARRSRQRTRHRLSGAQPAGRPVRHRLRPLQHSDPVVRRRFRHGRDCCT